VFKETSISHLMFFDHPTDRPTDRPTCTFGFPPFFLVVKWRHVNIAPGMAPLQA